MLIALSFELWYKGGMLLWLFVGFIVFLYASLCCAHEEWNKEDVTEKMRKSRRDREDREEIIKSRVS